MSKKNIEKRYAIIDSHFVEVNVIEEKIVGLFRKRKIYLVSYTHNTYLDGHIAYTNTDTMWVDKVYTREEIGK